MGKQAERIIKCDKEKTFFAAANSAEGFVSFYDEIFGNGSIERRYLIKGGPGTGKSTLMRRIAQVAALNGADVEYYRCSSDPDSLDGILIEGRVALIDATSPHCVEPEVVGARDDIINLGAFWDSNGLSKHRERIIQLSRDKGECYKRAYELLLAKRALRRDARSLFAPYFDCEKMQKYAAGVVKKLPRGKGFLAKVGLCGGIGMAGGVYLDTYEKCCEKVCFVKSFFGEGSRLLSMIIDEARANGNALRVSYDYLEPELPNAVYFEDCNLSFVLARQNKDTEVPKYINMKRFADLSTVNGKNLSGEYRARERILEQISDMAAQRFMEAGEYHFELENIYSRHMDYEELDGFSKDLCKKMLDQL